MPQTTVSEGLAHGPYVAARAGIEQDDRHLGSRAMFSGKRSAKGVRVMGGYHFAPQTRPREIMIKLWSSSVALELNILQLLLLLAKVNSVRNDTCGSAPPEFLPTQCHLSALRCVSSEKICNFILSSTPKPCELNPPPPFFVQEFVEDVLPFLTLLCNSLLGEGVLPVSQKSSILLPSFLQAYCGSFAALSQVWLSAGIFVLHREVNL